MTVAALQQMKRDGRKIVGVVAWDTPTAALLDRAGVDIVSVGDSVGVNLWGREREGDVTLDELALLTTAVRRGAERAIVSCDLPDATVAKAVGDNRYRRAWHRPSTKALEHAKARNRRESRRLSPPPLVPKVSGRFGLSSGLGGLPNRCSPIECVVESRAASWRPAFDWWLWKTLYFC